MHRTKEAHSNDAKENCRLKSYGKIKIERQQNHARKILSRKIKIQNVRKKKSTFHIPSYTFAFTVSDGALSIEFIIIILLHSLPSFILKQKYIHFNLSLRFFFLEMTLPVNRKPKDYFSVRVRCSVFVLSFPFFIYSIEPDFISCGFLFLSTLSLYSLGSATR